jgi:hypothetical protein
MSEHEKYRRMSDDELAEVQHGLLGKSAEDILIEREWRRRDRLAQHKLNRTLLWWSILGGAFFSMLGVIIGWLLRSSQL